MQLVLLEVAIVVLAILLSGLLAMIEAAVVASRRSQLRQMAHDGDRCARAALTLVEAPKRFLATLQLAITLVVVFAGAFGGVTLAGALGRRLAMAPLLEPVAGPLAVLIVVVAITLVTLLLGEMIPRQIGLAHPERIACAAALPMQRLVRLAAPLVRALHATTDAGARLLHIHPQAGTHVSEEEVKLLVREGQRAGALLPEETRMVERVLDLDQLTVRDLMRPRGGMVWLNLDRSPAELRERILTSGHSRFPVFRGRRDNLLGVISVKDLHEQAAAGRQLDLPQLLRKPLLVPPTQSAIVLLRTFRKAGTNFALVVDEFGGVAGLVTLHDVMRAIVGVLPDDAGDAKPQAVREADGSWTIDAMIRVDDLAELLPDLPLEEDEGAPAPLTFNGVLVGHCGRIPEAGESLLLGGHRVEILERDKTRVHTVRVSGPPGPGDEGGAG